MAKVFKLSTIKECLVFLEWLHNGRGKSMQGNMASALADRLRGTYKNVDKGEIQMALSAFLSNVSDFHKKLCTKLQVGTYTGTQPNDVISALLECVPKLLAALYFLRYNVDEKFKALGGGGWKDDWVAYYTTDPNYKYFHAQSKDNYLVIPGGFKPGEVTYSKGYSYCRDMASDLTRICEKYNNQFFRDIYATSILLEYSSIHMSNAANTLALVSTFCEIVKNTSKDGGEVKQKLDNDLANLKFKKCICWQQLKDHCDTIQSQIGNIFKDTAFSFTGYKRGHDRLNHAAFARETAKWLRNNLFVSTEKLNSILPIMSIKLPFNSRFLHTGGLPPNDNANLAEYLKRNFFPYGFTFSGNQYDTQSAPYAVFKTDWDAVIGYLKEPNKGLHKLKEILEGVECTPEIDYEGPDNKGSENVLPDEIGLHAAPNTEAAQRVATTSQPAKPTATKTEATKTEAVKAYASANQGKKSEGAQNQGKKSEGAQNQGKKVEGAQNQGKKSEGAQNQGKKVEGAQNQGKKSEGDSSVPSPPSAEPQLSNASPSGSEPSGALGPGSGRSLGEPSAFDTAQPGGKDNIIDQVSSYKPSAGSGDSTGGRGRDGGTAQGSAMSSHNHVQSTDSNLARNKCATDKVHFKDISGKDHCLSPYKPPPQTRIYNQKSPDELWREIKDKKEAEARMRELNAVPYLQGYSALPPDPTTISEPLDGSVVYHDADPRQQYSSVYQKLNKTYHDMYGNNLRDNVFTGMPTADSKGLPGSMRANFSAFHATPVGYAITQHKLPNVPPSVSKAVDFIVKPVPDHRLAPLLLPPLIIGDSVVSPRQYTEHDPPVPTQLDPAFKNISIGGSEAIPQSVTTDYIQSALVDSDLSVFEPIKTNNLTAKHDYAVTKLPVTVTLDDNVTATMASVAGQPAASLDGKKAAHYDYNKRQRDAEIHYENQKLQHQYDQRQRELQALNEESIKTIGEQEMLRTAAKIEADRIHTFKASKFDISHRVPPISLEITGPPTDDSDDFKDETFDQLDAVHDSQVYMDPYYNVTDDQFEITTVARSNDQSYNVDFTPADVSFDLAHNDVLATPTFTPLPPDTSLQITKPPKDDKAHIVNQDTYEAASQPLFIDIYKHILDDPSYELNIDDHPPPLNVQPVDPIDPSTPAINLNIDPFEVAPHSIPDDFDKKTIKQPDIELCHAPWVTQTPTHDSTDIPETEMFPAEAPRTVRDMLQWLAGLRHPKHHSTLTECFNNAFSGPHSDPSQLALSVNGSHILPQHVIDTIHLTAMFAGSVLTAIAPRWRENVSSKTVQPRSSEEPDCCALLCQLRDYVYACHHQLAFLKSQCKRDKLSGGWQNCEYGSDPKMPSPLQAFLTDGWDSTFETHPFDPCNLCHKSRVRMGFRGKDLPAIQQTGSVISAILTPSCGGSDPLLTLASYLTCLTGRTPRTTGELVSYFHHFGNELHGYASESLSPLGSSLTKSHLDCPDWDHLDGTDLDTLRGIRGTEPVISIHNSNHDNDHPRTLSTLVGCSGDSANCPQYCSPITYLAYALYSQSFAHTYLSWAVYLPDRLHESLQKLHYDLLKHCGSSKCTSLYSCSTALPLLYLHGFTPPEVGSQPKLTCQQVIAKLHEIVNGKPIADLMTAMDDFLYNIREPFIYTVVALWSLAFLIFANTMLYRIDVLHIRSHLIRTKASHLIDVKALLSDSKKMMSLYDANYFDDDPNELLNLR